KTRGKPLSIKALKDANGDARSYGEAIIKLFGTSGAEEEELSNYGPSRVSFSDCMLTPESRERAGKGEIVLTEVKSENSINRITGTAENPRFSERVPAGVEFSLHITMKIFDKDNSDELEGKLLEGLKLVEYDALGGSGSRGYGRVEFSFEDPDIQKKFESLRLF
ncbi:MAG: type III-A CRISPR-associated RAMP protein Csm3, partial [Candidatus Jordarchaeales archaeon]